MSGITGFIDTAGGLGGAELERRVTAMADALNRRGPDGGETWVDEAAGAALGFRYLAVGGLSFCRRGNRALLLDGEIYDRAEWRCSEVESDWPAEGGGAAAWILDGIERVGFTGAVKRLNGMFALALWDGETRRLFLARDRMGIRPLYYGWGGGVFLFGSELKALRAHPAFNARVQSDALALFLRYGYIPSPHTIYQGIFKLPPGMTLEIQAGDPAGAGQPAPYWSAREAAVQGALHPFAGSDAEAVDALDSLLRESVGQRAQADAPVGAFLSGGIDSSLMVSQIQAQSSRPVKTFSVGFSESGFNEAVHARAVADYLRTDHAEWILTPSDAQEIIPQLPQIYDEPFADSSQIPTCLVARLARRDVGVCISGDGGDEPYAGYTRYPGCARLWRSIGRVPRPLRLLARSALDGLAAAGAVSENSPSWVRKALRDRRLLAARSPQELYHRFISLWDDPAGALTHGGEPPTIFTNPALWPPELDFDHWMMYVDDFTLNPEDVAVKTDRAGAAAGLEIRAPLLDDVRLVEFAWRIPLGMKIRDGRGKWLLRQALYRYVPPELVDRPKQGFMIPLAAWLRGPLRPWAESLLDEQRLEQEGFFNPGLIRARWSRLLEKEGPAPGDVWAALMFQSWLEQHGSPRL